MFDYKQKGLPTLTTPARIATRSIADEPKALQAGVSLIITFFVMIIILAVVLSISVLLYSEVKIIKNMSDSMVSFFAADSGAEKVLYYDRQVIPTGSVRGICNICDAIDNSFVTGYDSGTCSVSPGSTGGCTDCTNCTIIFKTTMATTPRKYYDTVINVYDLPREGSCPLSVGQLKSVGTYLNTSRAVNLDITGDVKTGFGPSINDSGTTFKVLHNNVVIDISVVTDPVNEVTAYIYEEGGTAPIDQVELNDLGNRGVDWHGTWTSNGPGTYYISVGGYDPNGSCTSIIVTPG